MEIEHPLNPWARYADDAVIHCRTKEEADHLLEKLNDRFKLAASRENPNMDEILRTYRNTYTVESIR